MTPRPPAVPPPETPAAKAEVKVQKREAGVSVTTREKVCATCGRTFRLAPDEKFFNCPHCHRKSLPARKAPRKNEAQILTQIVCRECGTKEYVAFVPTDPAAALCAACFTKRKRELPPPKAHKERR